MNSPFVTNGFNDDHSSSSDDDYPYDLINSDSDSSDSDYDPSRKRSTSIVFVNGRQIKPKTVVKCDEIRAKNSRNANLNWDEYGSDKTGSKSPRRIRFVEDHQEIKPRHVFSKNEGAKASEERRKTTVNIRSDGRKSSNHGRENSDGNENKVKTRVFTNGPKTITNIKIQSGGKNGFKKSTQGQMITRCVDAAEERNRGMQRADSGILRGSSSSVSQDTSDSFDKEDGGTTGAKVGCNYSEIGSRKERKCEIDCLKSQLDSGFEDAGRSSPGRYSPKENSLKRRPKMTSDYSNVLRQASLRVFGLVGRKIKNEDEARNKKAFDGCVMNNVCPDKDEASNNAKADGKSQFDRTRKMIIARLEEIYKTKSPLSDRVATEEKAVNAKDCAKTEEEEDWPEPPSFDEGLLFADDTEMERGTNTSEGVGRNENKMVVTRDGLSDMTSMKNEPLVAGWRENVDERNVSNLRQNGSENEIGRAEECNDGSKTNCFQEMHPGSKVELKELSEKVANGFNSDLSAIGKRNIEDENVMFRREQGGFLEVDGNHNEKNMRGTNGVKLDDADCTICDMLSSERVAKRNADMERFRKTTLSDCDNVMKKMKHAQEIARKMSGTESPRRASMRKAAQSKADQSVTDVQSPTNRPQSVNIVESSRGSAENTVDLNAGPLDKEKNRRKHEEGKEKDGTVVRFANQPITQGNLGKNRDHRKVEEKYLNGLAAETDIHAAARQHCKDLIDSGGHLIPQFHKKKERPKINRNLSEDFLIVDAMPSSQRKGPGDYDKSRYHLELQYVEPRPQSLPPSSPGVLYDSLYHDEIRYRGEPMYNADPRFNGQPHFQVPHANHYAYDSDPRFGVATSAGRFSMVPTHLRENSPRGNYVERESAPPWQTPMMHHSNRSKSLELSPKGTTFHGPSSTYSQQSPNENENYDPFRAEREKSWFKKAARRLRRSLSFEDNERKRADKPRVPEQAPIKQCNSSGNLKAEYDSYMARETRGRSYSDEGLRKGISQAAKRSGRNSVKSREQAYTNDPNFHPKYGYSAQNGGYMQQSIYEPSSSSPRYTDASANVQQVTNSVVPHNMYFGNNPSVPCGENLEQNGRSTNQASQYHRDMVVAPLEVKKSSQKTAATKLLQARK